MRHGNVRQMPVSLATGECLFKHDYNVGMTFAPPPEIPERIIPNFKKLLICSPSSLSEDGFIFFTCFHVCHKTRISHAGSLLGYRCVRRKL